MAYLTQRVVGLCIVNLLAIVKTLLKACHATNRKTV